jgi:hypothetical protein
MGTGRNKPLLLQARRDDGVLVECIVKPWAQLQVPPCEYLFEWMGAAIGRALGVNVPAPLAVEIDPTFASSVDDAAARVALEKSIGVVFGSTYEKGYTQLTTGFALSGTLREEAARILAFDVFVDNVDRRKDNPNLFVQRDQFLAFDHEQAFAFVFPTIGGASEPDAGGCISFRHVLPPCLRGDMPPLTDFADRLALLDDFFFDALIAATPAEWTGGAAVGKIDLVTTELRRRRDTASTWLPKLEARMSK